MNRKSQHRHNLVAATSQAHQMQKWLLLALARPSTASTADAADLDVPSIAKEVAELVLWDLDSDFPYSSLNPMGNPSLSAPEPNESVWYAEASPSPEIGRKQTLLEDKKGWDKAKTSLSNLVGSGKEVACAWRALSSEADVRLLRTSTTRESSLTNGRSPSSRTARPSARFFLASVGKKAGICLSLALG